MERTHTTVTRRQEEFERIAMPHSRSLLRVARRLASEPAAAEDLVQEALLRAWRGFGQFRRGTNARAWLFRILFNAFYANWRKTRSAPAVVPLPAPGHKAEPHVAAGSSALEGAAVIRALEELSEEHRSVLMLAVVEGFTCRELADILSLPMGTVMSRLSRARQALRGRLEPQAPGFCQTPRGMEYAGKETG